jgi:glyoxylase-like metal-dependent hydrolase (beta-lactamase superfamily II)
VPAEPSIRVGPFEVVPLLDGWAPLALDDELPGNTVDWHAERARFPWAFAPDHAWAWHVRAFLVRTERVRLLVDTGIGHLGTSAFPVEGRIDGSLAEAGTSPGSIDHVIHTHLHADHAGGACHADGSPRFPNAVHHVHDADWRFFGTAVGPDDFGGRAAMAALETTGQLALSSDDRSIVPGVRVLHTPGHTPGHRCILLEANGDTLLLTGDLLHQPIQILHPEWASSHDEDEMLGVAARRILLFRARDRGWQLAVTHFARPFGTVTDGGWLPSVL